MAVIDSKKLLPTGKPGGSIVESQRPFLVPASNISFKKSIDISQKLLKPADKEAQRPGDDLILIKKNVLEIKDIFSNMYLLQRSEDNRKRKLKEKEEAEEREKQLEKNPQAKEDPNKLPKLSIPGRGILDTINRFLAFTFAGFLINNYSKYLPKLLEFVKYITPVTNFIGSFAKNLMNGVITFVDLGYKAYDQVNKTIESIGGKDAAKTFDDFSSKLNILLNGSIVAAMLIASTTPKKIKPKIGFDRFGRRVGQDTQRRYLQRYGERQFADRFGKKNLQKLATSGTTNLAKGTVRQSLRSVVGVPIIGSLIGFVIDTVVFREKPTRAAAGAVGNAVGQGIGIALAGGTTLGLGAGVGMFIGGFLGDIVGKSLYDAFVGYQPEPTQAKAQGGQISRGGRRQTAPSRQIRRVAPRPRRVQPQRTQPGRDVGGIKKIEALYGQDKPGQKSGLRALKNTSSYLKGVSVLNGSLGNIMGASVDLAMGQKFDKKTIRAMGDQFGFAIQNMVDNQVSMSLGDISRQLAMANGGVVPSRRIGEGLSVGARVSMLISNALSIALQSSAEKVLRNLNQELNLEGGAPDSMPPGPGGGPDGGPGAGTVSVSSDSPDFWLLAVGSLLENSHPQGAADVAQVIYNRVSSPSWPSTIRDVILQGNGDQFQPVRDYGNISAWKSIKDKESAVDFIKKYGKGRTQSQLESVAASLLDSSRQRSARSFVGPRDSFRATSFEDRENHLADDTEQRRHGHVFGFEPGGAQIGSFRSGKLSPAQVSPQTRGTVTQISAKGLPLTGENGRLKPSQLTRVGTLVGGVDYQDWYGNGAYLRNDAAAAFLAAKEQAKKEGITIPITSAYRSLEHQRAIQGKYAVVAAPGTSRHGEGTALDIQTGTAGYAWFVQNGPNFRWRYMAIPGDPVHFEYVGGFKPTLKQNKVKLSPIFDRTQATLGPSKLKSTDVAMNTSYSQNGMVAFENNTILYQKEFVLTG